MTNMANPEGVAAQTEGSVVVSQMVSGRLGSENRISYKFSLNQTEWGRLCITKDSQQTNA